jgi:hypothetical protein
MTNTLVNIVAIVAIVALTLFAFGCGVLCVASLLQYDLVVALVTGVGCYLAGDLARMMANDFPL